MELDILVVGAGFAGAVIARALAEKGRQVRVIDRRSHIAGNAYDCKDAHGILIYIFGPHIFHTNNTRIFQFLSRFTNWRPYEHRVLALVDDLFLPIPINRSTLNRLYGLNLDTVDVAAFLRMVQEGRDVIRTSEDVVLATVGRDLCEKFFRTYSRKQWGCDLSELSAGVAGRIPVRSNDDDRYFTDEFQFMPTEGYTAMFERLLDYPGITIQLNTSYESVKKAWVARHTIYTGPIDAFFDYCYGPLAYRSIYFDHEYLPNCEQFQPVGTVNFPNDYAFTRITEFKHITGQTHPGTSIVREYPQAAGEPYYPIPRPENEALYQRYKALANACTDVTFVGRLAEYRYYNMDQVVEAALDAAEHLV